MEHNALHILYLTSSYWKLLLFLFTVKKRNKAKPSYSRLSASASHLECLHVFLGGQTKSHITQSIPGTFYDEDEGHTKWM